MYVSHEGKFCFIRVPKTGSTSLFHALKKRYPDMYMARWPHLRYDQIKRVACTRKYGGPDYFGKPDYYHFGVVRNPLDWLRSMYDSIHSGEAHKGIFTYAHFAPSDPYAFALDLKWTPSSWLVDQQGKFCVDAYQMEYLAPLEERLDIEIEHLNVTKAPSPPFQFSPAEMRSLRRKFLWEFRRYKIKRAAPAGAA